MISHDIMKLSCGSSACGPLFPLFLWLAVCISACVCAPLFATADYVQSYEFAPARLNMS